MSNRTGWLVGGALIVLVLGGMGGVLLSSGVLSSPANPQAEPLTASPVPKPAPIPVVVPIVKPTPEPPPAPPKPQLPAEVVTGTILSESEAKKQADQAEAAAKAAREAQLKRTYGVGSDMLERWKKAEPNQLFPDRPANLDWVTLKYDEFENFTLASINLLSGSLTASVLWTGNATFPAALEGPDIAIRAGGDAEHRALVDRVIFLVDGERINTYPVGKRFTLMTDDAFKIGYGKVVKVRYGYTDETVSSFDKQAIRELLSVMNPIRHAKP